MTYHQITSEERYTLARLRSQVPMPSMAEMARIMGRHRSTISRELRRNICEHDQQYRCSKAQAKTNGRRRRSRRNSQFEPKDFQAVEGLLKEKWSPEQISGRLKEDGLLSISHETIYAHVWRDKDRGGVLWQHLRNSPKRRRKGYGSYDSRGRLAGKKPITDRPAAVESRQQIGHWEMDTVMGYKSKDCIITLVERVTGYVLIGKLADRTTEVTTQRAIELIRRHDCLFKTITADNGTEFHDYKQIELRTGVRIYFAAPYHSWERGTNENTNGLIRQYLPKRQSMHRLTQKQCNAIAFKLNTRPRKRHGYKSPLERLCAS